MTVAAVAARAGVAKGSIYLEFEDKHQLRDAVLRRATERVASRTGMIHYQITNS